MTSKFKPGAAALAITLAAAATAQAGGVVAPVLETAPVIVAPEPVASAWTGAYVGGSLGYVGGTDDEIGLRVYENQSIVARDNELGDIGIDGVTLGGHVGYRWQRGSWVFGPELGLEMGSVDGSRDIVAFGEDVHAESDLNYLVSLVAKTGYLVNEQTLVYGTFGIAHGDYDYSFAEDGFETTENFSTTGVAAGFGVERMMNENMSVFAEYQYRDFGNELVIFGTDDEGVGTQASMSQSTVKVGANWRF